MKKLLLLLFVSLSISGNSLLVAQSETKGSAEDRQTVAPIPSKAVMEGQRQRARPNLVREQATPVRGVGASIKLKKLTGKSQQQN